MLNLKLHIQPQTEKKLKKILTYTQDEEKFVQNIIEYQFCGTSFAFCGTRFAGRT